jgi:hypothetical protein
LQQNLPNAQLIVYPDSSHGSFYQYPELFVAQATQFLDTQFKAIDGASESLPFPSLPFPIDLSTIEQDLERTT